MARHEVCPSAVAVVGEREDPAVKSALKAALELELAGSAAAPDAEVGPGHMAAPGRFGPGPAA